VTSLQSVIKTIVDDHVDMPDEADEVDVSQDGCPLADYLCLCGLFFSSPRPSNMREEVMKKKVSVPHQVG
jgi:hypothetical protein